MKLIINKKNYHPLVNLQEEVNKWASEYLQANVPSLDLLHHFVNQKEVNALRMHLFNKLNSDFDWKNFLNKMIGLEIKELLGPDISIQNKINFTIKLPHDGTSNLGAHSDSWSNESPFQLNAWIPLTNVFDSNGMYLLSEEKSLLVNREMATSALNVDDFGKYCNQDFLNLEFGEILLFNPCLLHGNIVNTTERTRVSIHTRIKNLFAPETKDFPDRAAGIFYEPFLQTKNTDFALNFLQSSGGKIHVKVKE